MGHWTCSSRSDDIEIVSAEQFVAELEEGVTAGVVILTQDVQGHVGMAGID
jgi:isopentenyl phosphate kinase